MTHRIGKFSLKAKILPGSNSKWLPCLHFGPLTRIAAIMLFSYQYEHVILQEPNFAHCKIQGTSWAGMGLSAMLLQF